MYETTSMVIHGTMYTAYSVYTMYQNWRRLYDLLRTGFSYLSCTPTALDAHAGRAVPRGNDILVVRLAHMAPT